MRILKLKAENIKKIKVVEITPEGNIVLISGGNAEGKTSVLDSIWYALGGKKNIPDIPIRKGQDKAEIQIDMGDYIVTRTFTQTDSYLSIESKEGVSLTSPQKLLDKMIGDLSFDPMEFMKAGNREEILLSLVGVKDLIDSLNQEYDKIYTERREINRRVNELRAQMNEEQYANVEPAKISSIRELNEEMREAHKVYDEVTHTTIFVENIKSDIEDYRKRINEMEDEIKALKMSQDIETAKLNKLKAEEMKLRDREEIQKDIDTAEETNRNHYLYEQYKKLEEESIAKNNQSLDMTRKMNAITEHRKKAIKTIKFPLPGLSYNEGEITYNDIPLSQCSQMEQLKISAMIAMELALKKREDSDLPTLRVIRITDGSLIDKKNMKELHKLFKDKDFQAWIEVVDETGKVGIFMEDGMVKAINKQEGKNET